MSLYRTIFLVALVSHFMGDWGHHSLPHIALVSLAFAAAFTLAWAGIDRLTDRAKAS